MAIPAHDRLVAGVDSPVQAGRLPDRTAAAGDSAGSETRSSRVARRALDIVVSSVTLVLLSPVILLIAILVGLDSPGPLLFGQTRIGLDRRRQSRPPPRERRRRNLYGRPFKLWKFRTMYRDARERFPALYAYRYTAEELESLPIKVLVAQKGDPGYFRGLDRGGLAPHLGSDPRITRQGRWLRRTSLDELPNLFSVLKGDMHLVGPRPDIYENIVYYRERHLRKLRVKPGITGLAQINGRGCLSFEETNEHDLEYVETRSLRMDLQVLLRTIPILLNRSGAY